MHSCGVRSFSTRMWAINYYELHWKYTFRAIKSGKSNKLELCFLFFDCPRCVFQDSGNRELSCESGSIIIENFFTNYNDASITVSATLDGIERIRTWKYSDRSNDQKTPFNLSDCHFESGEDPRKNYTTMDYCFMIREEDLMQ